MIVPFLGGVFSHQIGVTELTGGVGDLQDWLAAHNCLVYAIECGADGQTGKRLYRIYHAALRH